jgi:uncharacterized protein with beta-barrel porin domain
LRYPLPWSAAKSGPSSLSARSSAVLAPSVLNAAFQVLPGSAFTVNGAAPPKNSALTTAAAELHLTSNWTAIGKFDGAFGSGAQTYGGTGTLRYTW